MQQSAPICVPWPLFIIACTLGYNGAWIRVAGALTATRTGLEHTFKSSDNSIETVNGDAKGWGAWNKRFEGRIRRPARWRTVKVELKFERIGDPLSAFRKEPDPRGARSPSEQGAYCSHRESNGAGSGLSNDLLISIKRRWLCQV
jgi:hypothetical protein